MRGFHKLFVPVVVALALAWSGTAYADDTVSVTLSPVNSSGVSGTAQLVPRGEQTEVILVENGEPSGVSEPVHIHEGPCESLNPKPLFPLHDVENGKSDTVLNVPLSSLTNGRYVINVHQSASNIGTYVACGPIPGTSPPSEIAWTAGPSMPSKRSSLSAAIARDGSIFAVGGSVADSEYPALVERYDPVKNAWTTAASLPTARYDLGVVGGPDGKIYAIGGCCGRDALPTVEAFDPATNTWTARANLPTARRSLGVALGSNGKIYAVGGTTDGKEFLTTVEEYDPTSNTWLARASMPTARGSLGLVATPDGKIYAIGGMTNGQKYLATVEMYDIATNTWTTRASMPTPRAALGVALETSGKILAIGGANTGHEELATVEEYDPAHDSWTPRAALTTARSSFATAVSADGAVYVLGGCCDSSGNFLSTVEVGMSGRGATSSPAARPSTAAPPTTAPVPTRAAQSTVPAQAVAPLTPSSAVVTPTAATAETGAGVHSVALPVLVLILAGVLIGAALVAAIVVLTRRSARPAEHVGQPSGPSGQPVASPIAPGWPAAPQTPNPSPIPVSSPWPGPPGTPQPASRNPSPPPASWAPAPVPSPWPPSYAPANPAAPTVLGWGVGPQSALDNLPGGYQVVGHPKSGGMASVYKAYQPSLDRYVALKVMSPTLTNDPVFVQRFYEEARRTARLEHPNIVPIYDIGQTPNGALFIAMRYVDGLSLQELLSREHPLDTIRAARIIAQVSSALDHAHGWGIIHRDVKPSNIMVENGDRVTLMDFGIAKLIGESQLTRQGAIVGTPKYLSPEQASGQQADHRSDIYALGVVFYEMLAGRAPFEADTPTALLYAHLTLPPPPLTELNQQVAPAVAAIVLKALAKNPAERYQSARELRQALRGAIGGQLDDA